MTIAAAPTANMITEPHDQPQIERRLMARLRDAEDLKIGIYSAASVSPITASRAAPRTRLHEPRQRQRIASTSTNPLIAETTIWPPRPATALRLASPAAQDRKDHAELPRGRIENGLRKVGFHDFVTLLSFFAACT